MLGDHSAVEEIGDEPVSRTKIDEESDSNLDEDLGEGEIFGEKTKHHTKTRQSLKQSVVSKGATRAKKALWKYTLDARPYSTVRSATTSSQKFEVQMIILEIRLLLKIRLL